MTVFLKIISGHKFYNWNSGHVR